MAHTNLHNPTTIDSLDEPGWGPLIAGDEVERYEVVRQLGVGGMAQVYEVRHKELDVRYALKLLHTQSPSSMVRLMREGRTQARLEHPNIVKVRDVFLARGFPALLMDYVEGVTLGAWARAAERSEREILGVFSQLLAAVAHAHDAEVVHRDLKPSNVLVSRGDVVHVTDFGIAKHVKPGCDAAGTLTQAGGVLGTPMYMAPEQFRDAGSVDARADLFALGVILYELCCGRRPFEASNPFDLLEMMERCDYTPIGHLAPDLSAPVRDAITSCLRPRASRIESARALIEALALAAQPHEVHEARDAPAPTRHATFALAGAATATLAAAAIWSARPAQAPDVVTSSEAAEAREDLELRVRSARLESLARRRADAYPGDALALLRAAASELAPAERAEVLDATTLALWKTRGAAVTTLPLGEQAFSVKFSPSGALVAVGGIEGTVQVWDVARAELRFTRKFKDFGSISLVRFSPNESALLLTPSKKNQPTEGQEAQPATLVSTRDGVTLRTFAHGPFTRTMKVDEAFEHGITTASDHRILLWDVRTGAPMRTIEPSTSRVVQGQDSALSPTGGLIAFIESDPSRVRVQDVETGEYIHELHATDPTLALTSSQLAFTHDGERLVLAHSRGLIVWDPRSGERLHDERADTFGLLALSSGERLVEGSRAGTLRLRSVASPATSVELDGERSWIYGLAFSDDSETFATASSDGAVGLWDGRAGVQRTRFVGARSWVLDVDVSSGTLPKIAAAGRDGFVRLYDDVTREIEAWAPPFAGEVIARAWSHEGRTLALLKTGSELWRWREGAGWSRLSIPDGIALKKITTTDAGEVYAIGVYGKMLVYEASESTPRLIEAKPNALISPSLGRGGKVCVSSGARVEIVDTATLEIVRAEETSRVRWHEVARDDSWCAYGNDERDLVIVPTSQGEPTRGGSVSGLTSKIVSSEDGSRLAVGTWHDTAEIWDARAGERIALLEGHEDSVVTLAWGPRHLVTGSLDHTLIVWDAETGARLHTLTGHTRDVTAARVDPEGRAVWSVSKDRTLRRWDLETGASLRVVTLPERAISVRVGEDEVVAMGLGGTRYVIARGARDLDDALTRTGYWTNLRVCEGTLEVRAVTPRPAPDTVWAPAHLCAADRTPRRTK